jgi:protein-S-isoprenylcysteine O-methyltransferase Ste14
MSPDATDGKPSRSRGRKSTDGAARVRPPAKKRSASSRPRLRAGEAIYLVAAVLLFVFMFFTWFGAEVSGSAGTIKFGGVGAGGSAWQSLEVIPIFLMLAIAVALGAAILRLVGSDWEPAVPPGAAVTATGLLATLLILYRIVFPPGFGEFGGVTVDATLQVGVFLALLAALGIAYGGWRAMAEEGTSFGATAKKLESPRGSRRKSST